MPALPGGALRGVGKIVTLRPAIQMVGFPYPPVGRVAVVVNQRLRPRLASRAERARAAIAARLMVWVLVPIDWMLRAHDYKHGVASNCHGPQVGIRTFFNRH